MGPIPAGCDSTLCDLLVCIDGSVSLCNATTGVGSVVTSLPTARVGMCQSERPWPTLSLAMQMEKRPPGRDRRLVWHMKS